jgi:hypothetical protein
LLRECYTRGNGKLEQSRCLDLRQEPPMTGLEGREDGSRQKALSA